MTDNRDYMYTVERTNKATNRTAWKCRWKNSLHCKARATTLDNVIVKFQHEHNHEPMAKMKNF